MALAELSLADTYLAWLLTLTIVFGAIALLNAENTVESIVRYLAAAAGVAAVVAAYFAVTVWLVIQVAS